MRINYILFLFICFSTALFSQSSYRFNNYSINEGLSQSAVQAIIQDHTNSIWVGTQDGLNRFNGKDFEVFNSDNTKGILSEYIRCSEKSKDGNLWFGTSNGLLKYDVNKECFKTYSYLKNTPLQIEKIAVDLNGNLWLASLTAGLLKFDVKTNKISTFSSLLPTSKVQGVYFSKNGLLYVNTEDKGLFKVNLQLKKVQKIIVPFKKGVTGNVYKVVECQKDKVLICTNVGVYEYSLLTQKTTLKFKKLYKEFGSLEIKDVYLTQNKSWLLATNNNGLFTIKKDGYIFNSSEDIFQKNALLNNTINSFFVDADKTYWIGSDRGLSSFNPTQQGFLGVGPTGNLKQGIPTSSVWSFSEDKSLNYLFIGTDKGVSRFNRKKGLFEHFDMAATNTSTRRSIVLCIYILDANKALVATTDGLFELHIYSSTSYDYKKIVIEKDVLSGSHTRIYSIVHYKNDLYFIGTNGGVVLYDLKTKKKTLFEQDLKNKENTISGGICRLISKDRTGKIWFATSTGGLNVLTTKSDKIQIVPYKFNAEILKLSKDYITSIYQENENVYWLGTFGSGMIKWNDKTQEKQTFNKTDGLPNNVIYGVLNNDKKELWMSTNKGISCMNLSTHTFVNYKEVNGLMSNEFNMGSFFKSKNGEFYFGGINGYNYFEPKNLHIRHKELNVKFTHLKIDQDWIKASDKDSPLTTTISKTKRLELSYKQRRNLTFQFFASDLSNPKLINYKYLIEGLDEGETFLGNRNEIILPSLSPGEYTLNVFARNGEGLWSENPGSIVIVINPPFWMKWWFWLLVGGVILLIIRFVFRQKVELERRKLVSLEMKITERTSEIRAKNVQIEEQNEVINKERFEVIEQKRLLQIEKDKTEALIRKIMPESTVEELKNNGRTSARAYKMVSILFTDFVGFTKIAEKMTPTDLVNKLDVFFRKFDEIIIKNNLEKIKTIGDAYMCAGGVPVRNNSNPIDSCLAALQIQAYMNSLKAEAIERNEEYWTLRLGINTGEVTAGVIGSEKLAYDIWGSAVNRAQRMEMMGEPGKVTVTGATYKLVEPYFECVFRGKAKSKNNNEMEMYTIERIKPQLSINGEGIFPNERFQQIVNLYLYSSINYNKAERHITKVLEKGLSKKLHYHCLEHVKDVVNAVENLALTENVTDEGLFLLKSAASYHDAGFIEQYDKNEPIGARLAEEILPKYGYTEQHINIIKELIYVTQIPHNPKNKLEEIICDADLDYLGRDDFHVIADRLRVELREHGKIDSDRKWDELQVMFLTNHKYFTKTAQLTRLPKKMKNLEEIKERLGRDEYVD